MPQFGTTKGIVGQDTFLARSVRVQVRSGRGIFGQSDRARNLSHYCAPMVSPSATSCSFSKDVLSPEALRLSPSIFFEIVRTLDVMLPVAKRNKRTFQFLGGGVPCEVIRDALAV
jgi:hypothetical protein